jgi:hypothetical protein
MNIKVPSPYETDTSKYFECTPDQGIRCIGAALSIDPQTHVIILAPDAVVLKRAWATMTNQPLDLKRAPILLYRYQTEMDRLQRDQLEDFKDDLKPKVSELKVESDAVPWFWFYRRKGNLCFIESHTEKESDIKLGEAKNCSIEECKRLLRENKIPRSCFENMKILEDVSDLIPF